MGTKPNTGFYNRWSVPADLVGRHTMVAAAVPLREESTHSMSVVH